MGRKVLVLTAALTALILVGRPAFAAVEGDDKWHFDLAPFYIWFANIDGDVGIGPIDQSIDADFGDIVDNLDMIVTAHFEARKGSWGLIFNLDYLNLGLDEATPLGPTLEIDFRTTIVEFDGFYRIKRDVHAFDFLAGLRYSNQDTEVNLNPGPRNGLDESWWDPILGARWRWGFAEKWTLSTRGDIGGFGVGTDFTWQIVGVVDWQPWKNVSLLAGYRVLDQDYEDGSGPDRYKWDGTMHGPVLGINFRW